MAMNSHLLIQSDVNKDEQLISLVEQNPVLYTQTHPKYMDAKYKQKVWETIGAFMEEDTLACKARWYNIRDNYRKSLRNNLTRSGSKKAKLYKYTTQLSFLSHYVDEFMRDHVTINNDDQDTRSTLPSPTPPPADESVEEPAQDSEHEEFLDDIDMKHETHHSDSEYTKDPLNSPESAIPSPTKATTVDKASVPKTIRPHTRIIRTIRRPVLKRPESSSVTTFPSTSESSNHVLELLVNKMLTTAENRDPVDAFLAGISPTLKSLHPYYQSMAKSEIFAVVQKYELKMLTEPPPLCISSQSRPGT